MTDNPIAKGSTVRLNSGGPLMTVTEIKDGKATTIRFGLLDQIATLTVPVEALRHSSSHDQGPAL